MKNKSTRDLMRTQKRLQKEAREIRDILDDREQKKRIPKLRKQYEGRFFVYMNSFGSGERWPLYTHCIKISEGPRMTYRSFQTDSLGVCELKFQDSFFLHEHLFQSEISKEEYTAAYEEFKTSAL